jgi:hypothetical protein
VVISGVRNLSGSDLTPVLAKPATNGVIRAHDIHQLVIVSMLIDYRY